jgi:UDP-N-acetylmuramate dehydrogenase
MAMNSQQRAELTVLCRSVQWEVSMAAYSTFRTGGVVEALVEIGSTEELSALLQWLHRHTIAWQVIGGGSNILVATRRREGVFIRLRGTTRDIVLEAAGHIVDGDSLVRVSGGCSLAALIGWCTKQGLSGLEFMAGIPGSVGGAVRMNAGAFGHAIGERVESLQYVTDRGETVEVDRGDLRFAYRSSRLPGEPEARGLITGVVLRMQRADRREIAARCREIIAQRKQKQPLGVGSAGSFFKNPTGDFAGRLIERAGLKGAAQGKAMVSPKHANFIVNTGGAVPEDILQLMEKVRHEVLLHSGVLLEPEIHIF